MASTPITATSYFGAKALNDVLQGNTNVGTALDLGFAAMPWMKPFRVASTAATRNQMNGNISSNITTFSKNTELYPHFNEMTRTEKLQWLKTQ